MGKKTHEIMLCMPFTNFLNHFLNKNWRKSHPNKIWFQITRSWTFLQ